MGLTQRVGQAKIGLHHPSHLTMNARHPQVLYDHLQIPKRCIPIFETAYMVDILIWLYVLNEVCQVLSSSLYILFRYQSVQLTAATVGTLCTATDRVKHGYLQRYHYGRSLEIMARCCLAEQ